jgi:hypothetical protein
MAPRNALTNEEIIKGFPTPVLPKIEHEPTFEYIQVTTRILNENTISFPSMSGGGAHDHLGIIMTHVEYSAISAAPWAEPCNPGAPPGIEASTNAVDVAHIARLHDEFGRIHTNRVNGDQALKRIILEANDNMYTSQLEYCLLKYKNRLELEI